MDKDGTLFARSVHLIIEYQKKDISTDIRKYILGFTYTDNATDTADDIELTLEDSKGLWHGDWLPTKGDVVKASFYVENWNGKKGKQLLPCGTFTIDKFDLSGPPDVVSIKGQAVPINNNIKHSLKTKSWKKINLSKIAKEIASNAGLTCMFECADDPIYKSIDQVKQSDIVFLQEICKDAGVSLKITDEQVVLFDEQAYESKEPITTFTRGKSNVLSYSFANETGDTGYSACTVRYADPKTNKVIKATFTAPDGKKGPVLQINEQVKSTSEATSLAKKKLREKNKQECTGRLSLMGDIRLVSGVTIMLEGWQSFDGKYIIQKATHNIVGGYTTDIEISKCLEGY